MTKIYRQALFSKCELYPENLNSEITVEINRSKTFSRSHRQPELLDNLSCSNQHKQNNQIAIKLEFVCSGIQCAPGKDWCFIYECCNIKWSDAGIQSINFPCELGWTAYSNIMVTIVTRSWCVDYLQLQTYYEDLKIRKNTKGVHLCPL